MAPTFRGFAAITTPMSGDEYMDVLGQRQATWEREHTRPGLRPRYPALLEWFILPGEEEFVRLPEPTPRVKPPRQPRRYRSAASLRQERDEVAQRMRQVAEGDDIPDRAGANLSPHARSRAARIAGRRRFARMDRALETYTRLSRRLATLNHQIAAAEAREAATPEVSR